MTAPSTKQNNLISRTLSRGLRRLREQLASGQAPFEYALLARARYEMGESMRIDLNVITALAKRKVAA